MSENNQIPFEDYVAERPDIQELIGQVRGLYRQYGSDRRGLKPKLREVPGYLDGGVDKDAFLVGEHVLKLVHPAPTRPYEAQIRPMKKALGIPGVEQLVSSSARETAMVTEYLKGTLPASLSVRGLLRYITPESVASLGDMLATLQSRGLYVDSPSNILAIYQDSLGFAVIDPLDSPHLAINDVDSFIGDVVTQRRLSKTGAFTLRPFEDQAIIRNAFIAASQHHRR